MSKAAFINIAVLISSLGAAGWAQKTKEPVDYVNPHLGGISYLLQTTSPAVQLPYGMMRIAPITTPGATDRYLADKIYGFPAGPLILMPSTGSLETPPA